jgi:two-component system NtrC family sensor kinase
MCRIEGRERESPCFQHVNITHIAQDSDRVLMSDRNLRDGDCKAHLKLPEDSRMLSHRILGYANSGVPRARFFEEVSRLLLEVMRCDNVRLVLVDDGRRFYCETMSAPEHCFRLDVTSLSDDSTGAIAWGTGHNDNLEQLCRDILQGRISSSVPWLTRSGSLWTGDIASGLIAGVITVGSDDGSGIKVSKSSRSVALIPIEAGQGPVGLLQLESQREHAFNMQEIESCESVAQTLGFALSQRRLQVALRERVKELTCLYGIARLVARPGITLHEVLQNSVKLLPPAWLYPEATAAKLVVDKEEYTTPGFDRVIQSLNAEITVHGENRGFVEVGYFSEKPQLDEGPFLSEERNLIDAISREISIIVEHKQTEKEKLNLQEQLRHADRLATIGQLAAGVAHELNEPLANILGFAQLAIKDPDLTVQSQQDIDKIVGASLHAREIIKKLLVFARETTTAQTLLDLNDLVENGLYFLESRCKKAGIALTLHLAEGLPRITADCSQLQQILTNLVVNSIQAMPNGGQLIVSTSAINDQVLLAVEDTGIGMSEEIQRHVFNPFFTTKAADQGTGLGLSVVHGIVTSHGGTIQVESKVGQGTRFTIRMPTRMTSNEGQDDNN